MLINQNRKFLFIHTYKVAGNSIRKALKGYDDLQHPLKKLLIPSALRNMNSHATAEEIKNQMGQEKFKQYFSFAFVRNPWDWQVSLYEYGLKDTGHHQHQLFKSFGNFEKYIRWRVQEAPRLQKEFVCDPNGDVIVDFVGRFENIDTDFNTVVNKLKIKNCRLPKTNSTVRKPYREYYNEETKELINRAFADDIQFFNYTY